MEITFDRYFTTLIGPNNAGKSNVLEALNLLFGERWPQRGNLEHRDFYISPDVQEPASILGIAARLQGPINLTSRDTSKWGGYVEEWGFDANTGECIEPWSEEWWRRLLTERSRESSWKKEYEIAEIIKDAIQNGEFWAYLVCEREDDGELSLGYLLKKDDLWQRIINFRSVIRQALVTVAYLPAQRSTRETLRVTQWNWYGNFVKYFYMEGRDQKRAEFDKIEKDGKELLVNTFERATNEVQSLLQRIVPNVTACYYPIAATLDRAHRSVTLFINDGVEAPCDEKGMGLQSLTVIALFQLYATIFHHGLSLLLIEEPENFLHLHARNTLAGSLEEWCRRSENRQVIVTTHSENFVSRAGPSGLRLIRRLDARSSAVLLEPKTDKERVAWERILRRTPEIVFANHVILVEGVEDYILPPLADILLGEVDALNRRNISVCAVDGKTNFKTYTRILDSLRIPWTILTDKDFLETGWEQFQCRLPEDFDQLSEDKKICVLEKHGIIVNNFGNLEDLYKQDRRPASNREKRIRASECAADLREKGKAAIGCWFDSIEPLKKAIWHACRLECGQNEPLDYRVVADCGIRGRGAKGTVGQ